MKDKRNVPTGKTVSEASPTYGEDTGQEYRKERCNSGRSDQNCGRDHSDLSDSHPDGNCGGKGDRGRTLLLVLQGAIIGIGGILPGVSGGVLCVIFGLYQLVIEVLANPIANLKRHWRLIIPVGIGVGLGFMGCAGLVSSFMEKNGQAAVCVFVGLILGMIPDLWRDARKKGYTKGSIPAMILSFLLFLALLLYLQQGISLTVTPNMGWYVFCGVAWGLSIIVPGLSSSSMLIYFGLYQPMLDGMAKLDPGIILPLAIGACAVVFTLSKGVNKLFALHYSLASHIILGIVIATTIPIIPRQFSGTKEILIDLACIVGGILAALLISRLCEKIAARKASPSQ